MVTSSPGSPVITSVAGCGLNSLMLPGFVSFATNRSPLESKARAEGNETPERKASGVVAAGANLLIASSAKLATYKLPLGSKASATGSDTSVRVVVAADAPGAISLTVLLPTFA